MTFLGLLKQNLRNSDFELVTLGTENLKYWHKFHISAQN